MWVEEKTEDIVKQKSQGNLIATGITPSGPIHLGNLRETMTAELVYSLLKEKDQKARLIYIADDFDRLRKVYPFLPKSFQQYIGWPLINIPDPEGCHQNYARHFLAPFFRSLEKLGIELERFSATEMYRKGQYTGHITTALKKRDQIKEILERVSGRSLPEDYQPFLPLCSRCGRIDQAQVTDIDYSKTMVGYRCQCGYKGKADYSQGGGKLPWRIDWAARWQMLGVTVEPFGKEHATTGGSYDTAQEIAKKIFNYDPPYPIKYEFIYLKGTKGKMASSTGNVISVDQLLEVVPPEIGRYLFLSSQPNRHLNFDPGEGLIKMINQYGQLEEEARKGRLDRERKIIYQLSQIRGQGRRLPVASFRHLVESYQATQGNFKEIARILRETGHQEDLKDSRSLKEQVKRVENWLEKYAPEEYKFEIQKELPAVKLSAPQKELLVELADQLIKNQLNGEQIHTQIYQLGERLGLSPQKRFEPIYQVLLGQSSGPKAGWFIASLDRDFVITRFKQAGEG
jgi:lysyl-tRNA synthetase, class I